MPRVSVIVPAYEASASIDATLASIAAQNYADHEVIVADDASQDDTAARAEAMGATVVRRTENVGPAAARNASLERASGELVAFLDADDAWLPTFLDRQVGRWDEERARRGQPPVGLIACDARIRTPTGVLDKTYLDQFRRVEPLTLDRVLARNCVFISAVVPRSIGEEVGWFEPDLFGTEDHDLWIRILERGYRALLTDEVLAEYRRHPGSVSSNIARMGLNNQRTYRRALARGRLGPRSRRIARRELTYNRAMTSAARVYAEHDVVAGVRAFPILLWVGLTRPTRWPDWIATFRGTR